ncbi:MAG: hypothetical protein WC374_03000 [Phycisphaerae bacterium]|jgi:hypothetical protein
MRRQIAKTNYYSIFNTCPPRRIQYSIPFLIFIISACFAVDLPKTAKLLPSSTILVLDIDDYTTLKSRFEKTSLNELYKDQNMSAFIENTKSQWKKSNTELDDNDLFKAVMEADVEPTGRLTLAFVLDQRAVDDNEPQPIVITQWGEGITKIKESIAGAVQKNSEMGGRSEPPQDFRGVKIESAVDELDNKFSYCFIDDCFILAANLDTLKFTVAQLKGATAITLADDPDYSAAMRTISRDNVADLYINLKLLFNSQAQAEPASQMFVTAFGLDNVSALCASIELAAEPRSPYKIKGLLKINGSKKGVFRMLDLQPAPLNAPSFIAPESFRLNVINLEPKKVFTELASIINFFGPGIAAMLYNPLVPASPDGQAAIMLKEDVIDYLAGPIVVAQSLKKPFSDNVFPSEYIVAASTTNRATLEKSLATWHGTKIAPDNPDAKRELLGHTIYLIKAETFPFLRGPGGTQPLDDFAEPGLSDRPKRIELPTFAFTVTDTHLIMGLETSVEQAIRTLRSGQSVTDARWFKIAKSKLPTNCGAYTLENTREVAEFMWWLLKKSTSEPGTAALAAPTTSYMLSGWDLDFTLLPDYDKVKKYFGLLTAYINSRDDGYYFEVTGLDQPEN